MNEVESKKTLKSKKGEEVGMVADMCYMATENGDTHRNQLKPAAANEQGTFLAKGKILIPLQGDFQQKLNVAIIMKELKQCSFPLQVLSFTLSLLQNLCIGILLTSFLGVMFAYFPKTVLT